MRLRTNHTPRHHNEHRTGRNRLLERLEDRQLLALTVATVPAANITRDSATIGAAVVETSGANPDLTLYWGDEDAGPATGAWDHFVRFRTSPVGTYTTDVTSLGIGTTYYYRAQAVSLFAGGVVWSDAASFRTQSAEPPTLTAEPVQFVSGTSADVSGSVLSDGGELPTVRIFFGSTDAGDDPADWPNVHDLGPQPGAFQARLSTLLPATGYFVRVAAENSGGLSWAGAAERIHTLPQDPLTISEFMAANATIITSRTRPTADGTFARTVKPYDWIELQNATDQPRDVGGYYLTDSDRLPFKWQFPAGTVIPAHGYLVVYASGEDVARLGAG